MKSFMLRTTKVLGASSLLLLLPYTATASTLAEELKACSGITNVMERLVCYDDLAERADEIAAGQRGAADARGRGAGNGQGRGQGAGRELSQEAQQRAEERRREAERRAEEGQQRAEERRGEAEGRADEGRQRAEERRREAEERAEEARQRAEEAQRRAAEAERRAEEAERRANQEREQRQRSEPITDKTYIEITDAWQNPRGLWRFQLDNGDVYEQISTDSRFQYQQGARYYLDPGFMNSLSLGRDGSNTKIRVRKRN